MSTSDYGFEFNGHHSSEFDMRVLNNKAVTYPTKNKVTVSVPYRNGVIDLSDVYGDSTFGERTITFPCVIPYGYANSEELYTRWTQIVNWLMSTPTKAMLRDDVMASYYYLGEVQAAPTLTEGSVKSTFTVVFQCDPFRYHPANNDIWDTFDFELDYAQETGFKVSGNKRQVLLFNIGVSDTNLAITTTNDVKVKINDGPFRTVKVGTLDSPETKLVPGKNTIEVSGNAEVEFSWVDEVI